MKRIGKCFAPKTTMWNMKRENGWENYKKMTDDNQELVELLDNEEMDSSELAKKVESVVTKIKFKAFGKVTVSNKLKEDKVLENLYMKRKHLLENEKVEQAEDVEVCFTEKLLDRQRSEYEEKLEKSE